MTRPRYAGEVIDLHTHSNFSDGSDSPAELARRAHELGLSAIALTDHDTTASHPQMSEACARYDIELVPGVEISLLDPVFPRRRDDGAEAPRAIHVLAYYLPLDPAHPLQQLLARLREDRAQRNHRLLERLRELGFDRLDFEDVARHADNPEGVGRPHFAAAMFERHSDIVGERTPENWSRLFAEWLGTGGRAYVPKTTLSLDDALAAALAEMAAASSRGVHVARLEGRGELFAEFPGRFVMATSDAESFVARALDAGVPVTLLGTVGGDIVNLGGLLSVSVQEIARHRSQALEEALELI